MHLAYLDESGDDGFPAYSSPLFTLSCCYISYLQWRSAFDALVEFRRRMKAQFGLPIKLEFHTRFFILNKNPYRDLQIADKDRVDIISEYCQAIAQLNLKIVNTTIVKKRITSKQYDVLDWALKMAIQRLENDLNPGQNPSNRFLIITDEGRVGKMRSTARRMQKVNYIPSKFGSSSYRKEIEALIEDPLPKNSRDSYFIQTADLVAFVVYLYCLTTTNSGTFSKRMAAVVTEAQVKTWMDLLKPSLNLLANKGNPYGIVIQPSK